MKVRGISYAGCGFKGTYHFGATAALKDHLGLGLSILSVAKVMLETTSCWWLYIGDSYNLMQNH